MLEPADLAELTALRHALHRRPDLSRAEGQTAATIAAELARLAPDQLLTGLGGHGVAAVFHGAAPGPTVMFRAELDGLPIHDTGTAPYRSEIPGQGHLCGHDGHMAGLLGAARLTARQRPACGRVLHLFQPAEEDGSGAAAVIADPRWPSFRPDWAFSLHNAPGLPLGHAHLRPGPVNCASQGLILRLTGRTAHASQPETGTSPAPALARLIPELTALGPGGALTPGFRLVTVTHARMGAAAFGIAPGEAELWLTLRTLADADMAALRDAALHLAETTARAHHLTLTTETRDAFAASVNHPEATARLAAACDAIGLPHHPGGIWRASEDFGRFGTPPTRSAMLFLGAGESCPALHNPDYDFPDALIPLAARLFHETARAICG